MVKIVQNYKSVVMNTVQNLDKKRYKNVLMSKAVKNQVENVRNHLYVVIVLENHWNLIF